MALFKGKGVPNEQVQAMQKQGMESGQIVSTLQNEGYPSKDVFSAMTQADMPQQNPGSPIPPPPGQAPVPQENQITNEELVEAIIDEKWNELVKDINKIIDWKNETESKFVEMQEQFKNLKEQFDKLHQAIIGKIGEYDKNILTVGAEVKAMEKVFSKVLPVFTEKVSELKDITDRLAQKD